MHVVATGERDALDTTVFVGVDGDLLIAGTVGDFGREVGVITEADLGIDIG